MDVYLLLTAFWLIIVGEVHQGRRFNRVLSEQTSTNVYLLKFLNHLGIFVLFYVLLSYTKVEPFLTTIIIFGAFELCSYIYKRFVKDEERNFWSRVLIAGVMVTGTVIGGKAIFPDIEPKLSAKDRSTIERLEQQRDSLINARQITDDELREINKNLEELDIDSARKKLREWIQ